MADSKWIALSYIFVFFMVFLGHIAYAFIPVYFSQHYNTKIDTTYYSNTTMSLSSAASTIPNLGIIIILIIIIIIVFGLLSGMFMNFGV